jgi:hypothetical protein
MKQIFDGFGITHSHHILLLYFWLVGIQGQITQIMTLGMSEFRDDEEF